jgi:protein-disulfide isomerase
LSRTTRSLIGALQAYLAKSSPDMLQNVASRKQQKEAARIAREQAVAQLKAGEMRRIRLLTLGSVVLAAVVAVVAFIIISSSNGGGPVKKVPTQQDGAQYTHAEAIANVKQLLDGIPESGNVLGSPLAPVTITEYGDLVCPVCDDFAITPTGEPALIADEVRTGKVRLVFKGLDTASSHANQSMFVTGQVGALSAGLQNKLWYYVMLVYDEQPQTINGQDAETVPYVTSAYLQNRAAQVPGLNLVKWQANLSNPTLIDDIKQDNAEANQNGAAQLGTPAIFVSGTKGTVLYDQNGQAASGVVPTISELQALIAQVS